MTIDRGVTRALNAVCGTMAVLAVVGVGIVVYRAKQSVRPHVGNPQFQEARRRAAVAERVGDLSVAEREYRAALVFQPKSGSLRVGLARVLLARDKREEAFSTYQPLVSAVLAATGGTSSPDADSLAWYGDLARERGDLETAHRAYRRAVEVPATSFLVSGPLVGSGPSIVSSGPRADGAASLDAEALAAHLRAGSAMGTGGPILNSERHLRRALAIRPDSMLARLAMANLRFGERRDAEALALLKEAKRVGGPGKPGWLETASLLCVKGDREEGLAMLRQTESTLSANDQLGWLVLVTTYAQLRSARQRTALDRAWAATPATDGDGWQRIATAYTDVDHDRALVAFAKANALVSPKDTARTMGLASTAFSLGQAKEAVAVLERALPYAGRATDGLRNQIRFYKMASEPRTRSAVGGPAFPGHPGLPPMSPGGPVSFGVHS